MSKTCVCRLTACLLTAVLLLSACAAPEAVPEDRPSTGKIYLYGEEHSQKALMDRELALWQEYYQQGCRHLFIEMPYYTGQLLNQYMASEDDEILDHIFLALEGTQATVAEEDTKAFYRQIKATCPETVFHGVELGFQYNTLGAEYLIALEEQGLRDSEDYRLAAEAVLQCVQFHGLCTRPHSIALGQGDAVAYREKYLYENFVRAFDALEGETVMGIFGTGHTGDTYNGGDTLAQKLRARYGDQVYTEELLRSWSDHLLQEPLETGELEVNGKTYPASYFGQYDLSAQLPAYQYREFWRLEGAYEDLSSWSPTGNVLTYTNYYPIAPKTGEVYAIHYVLADGSDQWEYHLCNGNLWNGQIVTEEVVPNS